MMAQVGALLELLLEGYIVRAFSAISSLRGIVRRFSSAVAPCHLAIVMSPAVLFGVSPAGRHVFVQLLLVAS